MKTMVVNVATTTMDLALMSLPVGTTIVTAHNKIFELDEIDPDSGRADAGSRHWIEPGTLQPFPYALDHWLPAVILPTRE